MKVILFFLVYFVHFIFAVAQNFVFAIIKNKENQVLNVNLRIMKNLTNYFYNIAQVFNTTTTNFIK